MGKVSQQARLEEAFERIEETILPCISMMLDTLIDASEAVPSDDRRFLAAELKTLAANSTIVCRCEDVQYGKLTEYHDFRMAKLQTRCGMGACQGRICGSAVEFLFGWNDRSVRPPIFPVRMENL